MLTILYLATRLLLTDETARNKEEALGLFLNIVKSPISIIFFIVFLAIAILCYFEFKDDILLDRESGIKCVISFASVWLLMVIGIAGTLAILDLAHNSGVIICYLIGMLLITLIIVLMAMRKAKAKKEDFLVGLGYFFCYEVYLFLKGIELAFTVLLFASPILVIAILFSP